MQVFSKLTNSKRLEIQVMKAAQLAASRRARRYDIAERGITLIDFPTIIHDFWGLNKASQDNF